MHRFIIQIKILSSNVFMKVFNEMQGFCGDIPFLAELERKLTLKGFFEDFKSNSKR